MDRSVVQPGLFGSLEGFPEGFSYEENILSLEEEGTLVRAFAGLPLKAFEFQGFGTSGVVSTLRGRRRGAGAFYRPPLFLLGRILINREW